MLDGIALSPTASVHNVAALLDSGLVVKDQMAAVATSAYYQLRLGGQLLGKQQLASIIQGLLSRTTIPIIPSSLHAG